MPMPALVQLGSAAPTDANSAARTFLDNAKAARTRAAYRADWGRFVSWCSALGQPHLPVAPEVLALYLSTRAASGKRVATIERELVAVNQAHEAAGLQSPRRATAVREVLKGIRRTISVAQRQKAPLLIGDLRRMLDVAPAGLLGARDRAILLVGFTAALRRSEVVGLDLEDIEFTDNGLELVVRRSKTDQVGAGYKKGIPYGRALETCPVRALRTWVEASHISNGPLFRAVDTAGRIGKARLSDKAVARAVKRLATRAGLDAARYSGHSLRAGLATSAAKAGKSERSIMRQTGHKSVQQVRRYIRDADLFAENAAADLGL